MDVEDSQKNRSSTIQLLVPLPLFTTKDIIVQYWISDTIIQSHDLPCAISIHLNEKIKNATLLFFEDGSECQVTEVPIRKIMQNSFEKRKGKKEKNLHHTWVSLQKGESQKHENENAFFELFQKQTPCVPIVVDESPIMNKEPSFHHYMCHVYRILSEELSSSLKVQKRQMEELSTKSKKITVLESQVLQLEDKIQRIEVCRRAEIRQIECSRVALATANSIISANARLEWKRRQNEDEVASEKSGKTRTRVVQQEDKSLSASKIPSRFEKKNYLRPTASRVQFLKASGAIDTAEASPSNGNVLATPSLPSENVDSRKSPRLKKKQGKIDLISHQMNEEKEIIESLTKKLLQEQDELLLHSAACERAQNELQHLKNLEVDPLFSQRASSLTRSNRLASLPPLSSIPPIVDLARSLGCERTVAASLMDPYGTSSSTLVALSSNEIVTREKEEKLKEQAMQERIQLERKATEGRAQERLPKREKERDAEVEEIEKKITKPVTPTMEQEKRRSCLLDSAEISLIPVRVLPVSPLLLEHQVGQRSESLLDIVIGGMESSEVDIQGSAAEIAHIPSPLSDDAPLSSPSSQSEHIAQEREAPTNFSIVNNAPSQSLLSCGSLPSSSPLKHETPLPSPPSKTNPVSSPLVKTDPLPSPAAKVFPVSSPVNEGAHSDSASNASSVGRRIRSSSREDLKGREREIIRIKRHGNKGRAARLSRSHPSRLHPNPIISPPLSLVTPEDTLPTHFGLTQGDTTSMVPLFSVVQLSQPSEGFVKKQKASRVDPVDCVPAASAPHLAVVMKEIAPDVEELFTEYDRLSSNRGDSGRGTSRRGEELDDREEEQNRGNDVLGLNCFSVEDVKVICDGISLELKDQSLPDDMGETLEDTKNEEIGIVVEDKASSRSQQSKFQTVRYVDLLSEDFVPVERNAISSFAIASSRTEASKKENAELEMEIKPAIVTKEGSARDSFLLDLSDNIWGRYCVEEEKEEQPRAPLCSPLDMDALVAKENNRETYGRRDAIKEEFLLLEPNFVPRAVREGLISRHEESTEELKEEFTGEKGDVCHNGMDGGNEANDLIVLDSQECNEVILEETKHEELSEDVEVQNVEVCNEEEIVKEKEDTLQGEESGIVSALEPRMGSRIQDNEKQQIHVSNNLIHAVMEELHEVLRRKNEMKAGEEKSKNVPAPLVTEKQQANRFSFLPVKPDTSSCAIKKEQEREQRLYEVKEAQGKEEAERERKLREIRERVEANRQRDLMEKRDREEAERKRALMKKHEREETERKRVLEEKQEREEAERRQRLKKDEEEKRTKLDREERQKIFSQSTRDSLVDSINVSQVGLISSVYRRKSSREPLTVSIESCLQTSSGRGELDSPPVAPENETPAPAMILASEIAKDVLDNMTDSRRRQPWRLEHCITQLEVNEGSKKEMAKVEKNSRLEYSRKTLQEHQTASFGSCVFEDFGKKPLYVEIEVPSHSLISPTPMSLPTSAVVQRLFHYPDMGEALRISVQEGSGEEERKREKERENAELLRARERSRSTVTTVRPTQMRNSETEISLPLERRQALEPGNARRNTTESTPTSHTSIVRCRDRLPMTPSETRIRGVGNQDEENEENSLMARKSEEKRMEDRQVEQRVVPETSGYGTKKRINETRLITSPTIKKSVIEETAERIQRSKLRFEKKLQKDTNAFQNILEQQYEKGKKMNVFREKSLECSEDVGPIELASPTVLGPRCK